MIDCLVSQPHYLDHLAPVLRALGPDAGVLVATSGLAANAADALGLDPTRSVGELGPHVLVASGRDALSVPMHGNRSIAHLDHGAGQTYSGDPTHPVDSYGYAGGPDLERVGLFLTASERVAALWHLRYPGVAAVPVGPCSLDPATVGAPPPGTGKVGITFHWPCQLVAECGTAWDDWGPLLPKLAGRLPLVGHAHPRWAGKLDPGYAYAGIPVASSWHELVATCDVLVADNSSVMYEWAALRRPVIALNARRWRHDVAHGLRFWDAVPGPEVEPGDLARLVELADGARTAPGLWPFLARGIRAAREAYGELADGYAPQRAAEVLRRWSS